MAVFNINDFERDCIYNGKLNKNVVIEASAGTGKTYSITKIVDLLVKKVTNVPNFDVTKILIVTYTEKATGELKDRIRKELEGKVPSEQLDNLNIYTIHSFCQNAIKEFGLEANQPLNLGVVDENLQAGDFFDRFVRDRNNGLLNDIELVQKNKLINEKLSICDISSNKNSIKKYMVEMLGRYYLDSTWREDHDIIAVCDDAFIILNDFKEVYKFTCFADFYANHQLFKTYYDVLQNENNKYINIVLNYLKKCEIVLNKELKIKLEMDNNWPSNSNERAAIDFFCGTPKFGSKAARKGINSFSNLLAVDNVINDNYNVLKNSQDERCQLYAYLVENVEFVEQSNRPNYFYPKRPKKFFVLTDLPQNDATREAMDFFIHLAEKMNNASKVNIALACMYIVDFYVEWQLEKEKNKYQTYSDMLRTIREALKKEETSSNKPFTNALKNKYQFAIIDEFQDTNQLQFDTFNCIFMNDDDHHIIVVGDPKQSIYSFQGADLQVYKNAVKKIIRLGGMKYSLIDNYRSSHIMVQSCNNFFNDIAGQRMFDDVFYPSNCPNKMDNMLSDYCGNNKAIWIGVDSNVNAPIDDKNYAKLVVETIVDSCSIMNNNETKLRVSEENGKPRNVRFRDFVILARTRTEMSPLIYELKKCGIPFIKCGDKGLLNSDECYHWLSILEAINLPDFTGRRRKIVKKALFTDFFGISLENLATDYFDHDDNFEIKLLYKCKELAKDKKWESLIDSIIFESKLLDRLKKLDKLQSLSLYKQLGDYCISYLYNNHTLDDLIHNLKGYSKVGDDEDAGEVEIGTDFDCVRLMTIHASKGLQFPVVISAAGWKGPIPNICVSIYHDIYNLRNITFNANDLVEDLKKEWNRLLYVCYTRAQYLMIIPYYDETSEKNFYRNVLSDRTKMYMNKYPNDYRPLFFNGINYSQIQSDVKDILDNSKTSSSVVNLDNPNNKMIIKEENKGKTFKHSYSSLSHPKGTKVEDLELEDGERDKENEIDNDVDLTGIDIEKIVVIDNLDESINHTNYDNYPRGNKIGSALHEILERLDFTDHRKNISNIIKEKLQANKIKYSVELEEYIKNIVDNVLNAKLPTIEGNSYSNNSFKLNNILNEDKHPEIEFNFNAKDKFKNYFNGFIDLLFYNRETKRYSILDWKSDTLNDKEFSSYSDKESLIKHTDKIYSIQRVLYSYTLIKWLKNFYSNMTLNDIFDEYFGGIYYVYIRGCNKDTGNGIYAKTWESFNELEDVYNKKILPLLYK